MRVSNNENLIFSFFISRGISFFTSVNWEVHFLSLRTSKGAQRHWACCVSKANEIKGRKKEKR